MGKKDWRRRGRQRDGAVTVAPVSIQSANERAPKERSQHDVMRIGEDGTQRVVDGFAALRDRRMLDKDGSRNSLLYEAGDRYRTMFYHAGLSGLTGVDLNGIGGGGSEPAWGMPASEFAASNRIMWRRATDAVRETVGVRGWTVVHSVTVEGKTIASLRLTQYKSDEVRTAIGMDLLRQGLAALAVHWGMLRANAA